MLYSLDPRWVCVALVLAVTAYAFYTYYHKTVLGRLVRALLESRAESEETAKTFSELGLSAENVFCRAILFGGLSSVVTVLGLPEKQARRFGRSAAVSAEQKAALRLYIAPEKEAKAYGIYAKEQNVLMPVVLVVGAVLFSAILSVFLPEILKLFQA